MAPSSQVTGPAITLSAERLRWRETRTNQTLQRWRAASRMALLVLLAGSLLQYYLLHVYLSIATLPVVAVALLR
jgi:hypothetical protein